MNRQVFRKVCDASTFYSTEVVQRRGIGEGLAESWCVLIIVQGRSSVSHGIQTVRTICAVMITITAITKDS